MNVKIPVKRTPSERRLSLAKGVMGLGDVLGATLKPVLNRGNTIAARLLTEWPAIAGPEIAGRCWPEKIRTRTMPGHKVAVLSLLVNPQDVLDVQYAIPVILERIQVYFGYPAIQEISIRQEVKKENKKQHYKNNISKIGLRKDVPSPVLPGLENIQDISLRQALEEYGNHLRLHSLSPSNNSKF
ncbi:MAG: DUF721 domain-containing protein [Hyphomicrobiales bacterium]|nr:DUF721 domain-containing protein [Rickettsiales bacterium]MCP5362123.1 DUF721 domain-containing protein [Hyphomicrobiales bacterium]